MFRGLELWKFTPPSNPFPRTRDGKSFLSYREAGHWGEFSGIRNLLALPTKRLSTLARHRVADGTTLYPDVPVLEYDLCFETPPIIQTISFRE